MMSAEDDDGGTIGQRACGADDVNAGDVRQPQVEHHDIERPELTDGGRAVRSTRDGVALEPKNLRERVASVSIVLRQAGSQSAPHPSSDWKSPAAVATSLLTLSPAHCVVSS